ncbi:Transcriptional regulatory protein YycF [Rubripirellula tenax]|uniref:Transcriptional regulatory protein YycF n=2 Tax=Rubripirellula tenax TaxID=2528015 RepID=A0A5C6F4Y6_9BACT|nr:Transcriptional regulatory protein YycF [Rubripirellula tenax]
MPLPVEGKSIVFNSSGVKLLLVLSEPVLADLTSFRLELLGYQVETVASGNEASASISKSAPALIIVDTMLADGDGLEWVARTRADQSTSEIPVLIFSIDTSLETVERAFHAGAQDYLISPFDPMVMEEKVERRLAVSLSSAGRKRPSAQRTTAQGATR